MNWLFQVVIPAISGLLSGTIASLVAPWINWRIEQHREKLAYRRAMIRRWRDFLATDFEQLEFGGSAIYSEMRPHLSKASRDAIEDATITVRMGRGGNIIHSLVLDDIARLGKDWNLV